MTQAQAPSRPSYYWQGFVLGFVLLSLASCGSLAVLLGLDQVQLTDLTGAGVVWTPPPAPTAAPSLAAQENTPDLVGRFHPGQSVRNITSSRVNLRRQPGYLSADAGDILTQIEPGELVSISGGPQIVDQLTWWLVDYAATGASIQGWVAEATASGVQILSE